ncbi:Heat induced stress protein YflT [Paenibacillus sp. UNCCL117]|uniref:general stress protein n=1 Tax=unclassified Paenibacillus TaxID=185978 RepID=UPI00087FBA16|nr:MULTISPECIES: general stress protein [unclassified Paenibacillus]SDE08068.1 Heat induced stress protein YflT [Paenibacillus sp. cl123]SFW59042.1 Heat induced stress protein YflT [Paenibacillus sp. UNCCL117]
MFHSIIVANGEQEVRKAVSDLRQAGREVDQIQILAHEGVQEAGLNRPQYMSRIGFVGEKMAHTATPLYKCKGSELKDKLLSLGLSESAVEYYAKEMAKGHIVIAVDDQALHQTDAGVPHNPVVSSR